MKLQRGKAYRLMPGATHVKVTKEGDLVAYRDRNPRKKAKAKPKPKAKARRPTTRKQNPATLRGYQAIRHAEVTGAQLRTGIRTITLSEARRIAERDPGAVWTHRKKKRSK